MTNTETKKNGQEGSTLKIRTFFFVEPRTKLSGKNNNLVRKKEIELQIDSNLLFSSSSFFVFTRKNSHSQFAILGMSLRVAS